MLHILFFYLAALIDNKVDIGYHLMIEDEFGISETNINKSKERAEACMAVGLENCELLKEWADYIIHYGKTESFY